MGNMFLKVLFCGVLSCDMYVNVSFCREYRPDFSVVKLMSAIPICW